MRQSLLSLVIICLWSCAFEEKKYDAELPEPANRIVVDAPITLYASYDSIGAINDVEISITKPFPYTGKSNIEGVTGLSVYIITPLKDTNFFSEKEQGLYVCDTFRYIKTDNSVYELYIKDDRDTYYGKATYVAGVPIKKFKVNQEPLEFFGEDRYIDTILYDDPKGVENFYTWTLFRNDTFIFIRRFPDSRGADGAVDIPSFFARNIEDTGKHEYFQTTITETFYNYLEILSNNLSSSPFSPIPATAKGNIVNQTSPKKYPLGYFNIQESDSVVRYFYP